MQGISGSTIAPSHPSAPLELFQWKEHTRDILGIAENPESSVSFHVNYNPELKIGKISAKSSFLVNTLSQQDIIRQYIPSSTAVEVYCTSSETSNINTHSASTRSITSSSKPYQSSEHALYIEKEPNSINIHNRPLNTPFLIKASVGDGLVDVDASARVTDDVVGRFYGVMSTEKNDYTKVFGAEVSYTGETSNVKANYSSDGHMVGVSVGKSIRSDEDGRFLGKTFQVNDDISIKMPDVVDVGGELVYKFSDYEDMYSFGLVSAWEHPLTTSYNTHPSRSVSVYPPFIASAVMNGIGTATLSFSGPLGRSVVGDETMTSGYNSYIAANSSIDHSSTNKEITVDKVISKINELSPIPLFQEDNCVYVNDNSTAVEWEHNLGSRESRLSVGVKSVFSVIEPVVEKIYSNQHYQGGFEFSFASAVEDMSEHRDKDHKNSGQSSFTPSSSSSSSSYTYTDNLTTSNNESGFTSTNNTNGSIINDQITYNSTSVDVTTVPWYKKLFKSLKPNTSTVVDSPTDLSHPHPTNSSNSDLPELAQDPILTSPLPDLDSIPSSIPSSITTDTLTNQEYHTHSPADFTMDYSSEIDHNSDDNSPINVDLESTLTTPVSVYTGRSSLSWSTLHTHALRSFVSLFAGIPTLALQYSFHKDDFSCSIGFAKHFPISPRTSVSFPPLPSYQDAYRVAEAHPTQGPLTHGNKNNEHLWIDAQQKTNMKSSYTNDPITNRLAVCGGTGEFTPTPHTNVHMSGSPVWNIPGYSSLSLSFSYGDFQ